MRGGADASGRDAAVAGRPRGSIDAGVPAIAWGPMRAAQQKEGAAGNDFLVWENRRRRNLINWALLVGYDEQAQTYVVRHPVRGNEDYEVRFDGFGTSTR